MTYLRAILERLTTRQYFQLFYTRYTPSVTQGGIQGPPCKMVYRDNRGRRT